jgi:uncharacterized protein (TIGR03435 family)
MKKLFPLVITLSLAAPVWTQAPARPSFEVASVKQDNSTLPNGITGGVCHGSDAPGQVGIPGMTVALGRCRYVGARIKMLINNAYGGIAGDRIIGGPGWVDSLGFSIDAKAEDGTSPTRPQLMEMMRTLLEDRFKLKFHRETKEVMGYALVVGKNGIKLKESEAGSRPGVSSRPGNVSGSVTPGFLADMLTRTLGVPVNDATGITTRYDIDLKWTPEVGQPGATTATATNATDPTGPSIFTAIQEIGLRLEPKKATIELFVIDSIEKPDSN